MIVIRNNIEYDLATYGLKTLKFNISSPSPRTITETIENKHGYIDMGTSFEGRLIKVAFFIDTDDIFDFRLFRKDVFNVFDSIEAFYIIDKKEPNKRWKVKVDSPFNFDQLGKKGFTDVTFISESPFAESVGTTKDNFTFESGLWGIGMNLDMDKSYTYTHSTSTFNIENLSDTVIDPRELPLTISFNGASTNLSIKNLTTGETWSFTGTSTASNTITLDGIRSLKNGVSIFGDTNRNLITLAKGTNAFEITGATGSFTISFNFRFYYL